MSDPTPLAEWPAFSKLPNGVQFTRLHDTELVVSQFETFSYSQRACRWAEVECNRAVALPQDLCGPAKHEFWALVVALRAFDAGLRVQFGSDITLDPLNTLVVDADFKRKALEEHPLASATPSLTESLAVIPASELA